MACKGLFGGFVKETSYGGDTLSKLTVLLIISIVCALHAGAAVSKFDITHNDRQHVILRSWNNRLSEVVVGFNGSFGLLL